MVDRQSRTVGFVHSHVHSYVCTCSGLYCEIRSYRQDLSARNDQASCRMRDSSHCRDANGARTHQAKKKVKLLQSSLSCGLQSCAQLGRRSHHPTSSCSERRHVAVSFFMGKSGLRCPTLRFKTMSFMQNVMRSSLLAAALDLLKEDVQKNRIAELP